uniref:Uncharacterized protein n=1 Tax=Zea mays TaxID=4577 RepID=A0A804U6T5_MAIZE
MEPEAAVLAQLQLQLLVLVSEFRHLRERERGAREELRDAGQRWEAAAAEQRREARELRVEVASRDDSLRRLEARDSTCSMQWTIQLKDKQIAVMSEKLNSHLVLFSSVEKEVAAVKQVLGDVHCLVGEKENVVADLKDKVQRISVLEKDFVENLNFLESKISAYQLELRSRARIIYELKNRLQDEKLNSSFQPHLEELNKTLLVKDYAIDRLTSENQAMRLELHNMEIALQKFQDLFSSIGHEGMNSFSAISENQDVQDVNNEQHERVPGTQCGLANEHTLVTAVVKEATTQNVDHQLETDPGSMQVQSPVHFKSGAMPSPELVAANTEKADSLLEPNVDIGMGSLSPARPTDCLNMDLDTESQS